MKREVRDAVFIVVALVLFAALVSSVARRRGEAPPIGPVELIPRTAETMGPPPQPRRKPRRPRPATGRDYA